MTKMLFISLGAVAGANARYWLGLWTARHWSPSFPHGTLLINLIGSLLLGLFLTTTDSSTYPDQFWHPLLAVGFLGAFTTFSTYTFESVTLILNGRWGLGMLDLLGSAILGAGAVGIGIWIGHTLHVVARFRAL
ncbi:MAG: fluoride efflux transporter CrcB [Anaerolineae bacterium]|nr:fluoride efflux transporter CrcB [Anaerolineae bacterium]